MRQCLGKCFIQSQSHCRKSVMTIITTTNMLHQSTCFYLRKIFGNIRNVVFGLFFIFLYFRAETRARVIPENLTITPTHTNTNTNHSHILQPAVVISPNSNYDTYDRFVMSNKMYNNYAGKPVKMSTELASPLIKNTQPENATILNHKTKGSSKHYNPINTIVNKTANNLHEINNISAPKLQNKNTEEAEDDRVRDSPGSDDDTDERLFSGLLKSDIDTTDFEDEDFNFSFINKGNPNFLASLDNSDSVTKNSIPEVPEKHSNSNPKDKDKDQTTIFPFQASEGQNQTAKTVTSFAFPSFFNLISKWLNIPHNFGSQDEIETRSTKVQNSVVINIENDANANTTKKVRKLLTTTNIHTKSVSNANKLNIIDRTAKNIHSEHCAVNNTFKNNAYKLAAFTPKRRIRPDPKPPEPEVKNKIHFNRSESISKVNKIVKMQQSTLSRSKRQVEFNMYFINRKEVQSGFQAACDGKSAMTELVDKPLLCYQCESYSADKEPRCDANLWEHLRHKEKQFLRIRCPQNKGHYCVKSVSIKESARFRTVRGCFGPGPVKTKPGKHIKIKEGCMSYYEGEFLTTTCFCKSDLCNCSPPLRRGNDGSFISLLIVCWALLIYAVCYSFISR